MKAFFTKSFKKSYAKRIRQNKNLIKRFDQRYDLFIDDPSEEVLKDHKLSGKLQGYRSFSVTGDIRVVYYIHHDMAYFVDIGTHNQIYGR